MEFAATWVDLETIVLSEVSQKEKNKCQSTAQRNLSMKHFYVNLETDAQIQRTDLWLPRGRRQGREGQRVWDLQM